MVMAEYGWNPNTFANIGVSNVIYKDFGVFGNLGFGAICSKQGVV